MGWMWSITMGRPPDCACYCGIEPPVGPSSVCSSTADFLKLPWVDQTVSGCSYTKFLATGALWPNSEEGEVVRLSWNNGPLYSYCDMPWATGYCNEWWSEHCNWYCNSDYWNYWTYYQNYVYLPCANRWGEATSDRYNLVITKEAYFGSGVYIFGAIKSLSNFVDAAIFINDGTQKAIVAKFDYQDEYYAGRWLGHCLLPVCETGVYQTKDSGCFRITVSGSTNRAGSHLIYPSGFIDFWILPSANKIANDFENSFFNYNAACVPLTSRLACYDDFWADYRNCYGFCGGYSCCQSCSDCVSEFCAGAAFNSFWWNGFWNFDQLRNSCSGNVDHPECGDIGSNPWGGSGWRMEPWSCLAPLCGCEDIAACCLPNGVCIETDCKSCEDASGVWHPGRSCVGADPIICFAPPES
jgi:hypothetical protein